jgi:undecaprenyl-diphosphatase
MLAWNRWLFLSLNASDRPDPLAVLTADFAAQALVFVALVVAAGLWIWGSPSRRGAVLAVAIAAAIALGVNQLLGLLWFEPRPFMIDLGHTLLAHVPENSFPSDHATLVWALGAGLIATGASVPGGAVVTAIGLAIAWARIYLGLHFPIDMATSGLVAACGGALARASQPPVERMLLPVTEAIYERALRLLGLPAAVFPRRAGPPA